MFCRYFLLVCSLSFHFLNTVFMRAEVLDFDEVQFIEKFLMVCAICVLKSLALTKVTEIFFFAFFRKFHNLALICTLDMIHLELIFVYGTSLRFFFF